MGNIAEKKLKEILAGDNNIARYLTFKNGKFELNESLPFFKVLGSADTLSELVLNFLYPPD